MNTSLFLFTPREVVCDKIESCKSALKLFASKVSDTYYVASYLSLYTTEATMRVQWRLSSKAAFYMMVPWMVASIITTLPGLESLSWKATHLAIFVVGRRGCPSHKQGEPLHTATYENKNKQRVKRSQTWQPTRSQTKSHEKGEGYTVHVWFWNGSDFYSSNLWVFYELSYARKQWYQVSKNWQRLTVGLTVIHPLQLNILWGLWDKWDKIRVTITQHDTT